MFGPVALNENSHEFPQGPSKIASTSIRPIGIDANIHALATRDQKADFGFFLVEIRMAHRTPLNHRVHLRFDQFVAVCPTFARRDGQGERDTIIRHPVVASICAIVAERQVGKAELLSCMAHSTSPSNDAHTMPVGVEKNKTGINAGPRVADLGKLFYDSIIKRARGKLP